MENRPLISVIIPTYNRPEYLLRAVTSVLNQTWSHLEVIVVDDNSSIDNSGIADLDQRIIYHKNKENEGANYCRNKGISLSTGDYLNFLDDDDEFLPHKLKEQLSIFERPGNENIILVTCHMDDGRSGQSRIVRNPIRGNIYHQLLKSYCLSGTLTMLIKKSAIDEVQGFDANLVAHQEYDLSIRLARIGNFDFADDILCRAGRSEGQISTNFKKKCYGTWQLYKKYFSAYWKEGFSFFMYNQARFGYLFALYLSSMILGERFYRLFPGK